MSKRTCPTCGTKVDSLILDSARPVSRCKTCGEVWPATSRLTHCSQCCRTFGGIQGYRMHKVKVTGRREGRCATETELVERGLTKDEDGRWRRQKPSADVLGRR